MISQIVIQLRSARNTTANDKTLEPFVHFLARVLAHVPVFQGSASTETIENVQSFVMENEADVGREMAEFVGQGPEKHILVYSFAQNFRFLVNARRPDRKDWIDVCR
jgi:hypothetical protein